MVCEGVQDGISVSEESGLSPRFFAAEMDPSELEEAWLCIYHHTAEALCQCDQFEQALDTLERMRRRGLRPRISAVPSLLRAYISPAPSRSYMPIGWQEASDGSSKGSVEVLLAAHRQLLQPLHGEIVAAVAALTTTTTASPVEVVVAHSMGQLRAAFSLLRSYVNVLCQLNLIPLAEETLETLRRESKHSQVASKMPVLYPLINAYSVRGDWEKAMELYFIADSSGNSDSDSEEEGGQGGRPVSKSSAAETDCYPMAFHSVCDALRKAGRVTELGHFMSLHSGR